MTINGGVRTREPVRRAEGSRVPASLIEVIDAIPDECYVQPTARGLGLVGAVKGGPRDVAERHSQYLKAKLRGHARRTR